MDLEACRESFIFKPEEFLKLEVSLAENQDFSRLALLLKTPGESTALPVCLRVYFTSHDSWLWVTLNSVTSPVEILLPLSHVGFQVYIELNHILKANLSTSESLISNAKVFLSQKVNSQLWGVKILRRQVFFPKPRHICINLHLSSNNLNYLQKYHEFSKKYFHHWTLQCSKISAPSCSQLSISTGTETLWGLIGESLYWFSSANKCVLYCSNCHMSAANIILISHKELSSWHS